MTPGVSILIPAHDEEAWLPACLDALLASASASAPVPGGCEVIVIANGCRDATAAVARGFAARFADAGCDLKVIELPDGGKLGALSAGEAAARGAVLVYLDADVRVSAPLVAQIADALATDAPRYASGRPRVTVADQALTRLYTRFWLTTPFVSQGVPGFGIFAMNRAGRGRWGDWPDIISDDTFARLNFAPSERVAVPAAYDWPMIEGFAPLVRVRRRQNVGVAEIASRFPALLANADAPEAAPLWRRALRDPLAFATYCAVRLAVRLPVLRNSSRWARGR